MAIPSTDFHMHAEYSSCSDDVSILKNIEKLEGLGYERIAITDHGTVADPSFFDEYVGKIETARKNTSQANFCPIWRAK